MVRGAYILFASGFDARKTVFALVPTGDPSSLRFGHPDVTTGDTVFPRFVYLMSRRGISIPLRVCGSGVREIPPVRWAARGFRVRPVPSELGWGKAVAV